MCTAYVSLCMAFCEKFSIILRSSQDHDGKVEVFYQYKCKMQWKIDLADTDLSENLDLKDIPLEIWATIFDF